MKKLFIAALIFLAAGNSAFASDVTKISGKTKTSFDILFPGASSVVWGETELYLSASFILDEENLTAFFTKDGELIGTTQKVELNQIPAKAIKKIKKEYASFRITDSIEFSRDDTRAFYVMVEDGNRKQILEITPYGNVSVFKGRIK